MADYTNLQTDIADEIARSDLTSQIKKAIIASIDHYSRERFWFNETTFTFSASSSQEFYGSADASQIAKLVLIDSVRITVNNSTYNLMPRDWAYLENIQSNSAYTGDPIDFNYYNRQLRLYPIPFTGRELRVAGVTKDETISLCASGSVSSYWTNDAFDLIKGRSKYLLFRDVIRSPEEAQIQKQAELEELFNLRSETTRRTSSGKLRNTGF